MKKLIFASALLFSALSLTLTSCGGGGNNETNQDSVKEDTSAVVKQVQTDEFAAGKAIFEAKCVACHQTTGLGIEGTFPPLAGSDYLANKQLVVKSVLTGLKGKVTVNGKEFNSAMPANALTDQEAADVLNYVFNSWGNAQGKITVEEVAKFKAAK